MNHSHCTIVGRLTKAPHFKQSDKPGAGGMCSFDVAFTTGWGDNEKTNYIRVLVFGKHGESCQKHLVKGQEVLVHGELVIQPWKNEAGQSGVNVECRDAKVKFGAKPRGSDSNYDGSEGYTNEPDGDNRERGGKSNTEDDLPF